MWELLFADGSTSVEVPALPMVLGRVHVRTEFKPYTSREQCRIALVGGTACLMSVPGKRAALVLPAGCEVLSTETTPAPSDQWLPLEEGMRIILMPLPPSLPGCPVPPC